MASDTPLAMSLAVRAIRLSDSAGRGTIRQFRCSGVHTPSHCALPVFRNGTTQVLPARDVYGIRIAKSELGYKSLGPATQNVTKAQRCRAEVHLESYGWIPIDPADVRKVVLEEPPGNRPLEDDMVKSARTRLFGSCEMNWMAYNFAHDVVLPGAKGERIGFLMYPQAATSGGRLDSLDADNFKYEIQAKEIATAND